MCGLKCWPTTRVVESWARWCPEHNALIVDVPKLSDAAGEYVDGLGPLVVALCALRAFQAAWPQHECCTVVVKGEQK